MKRREFLQKTLWGAASMLALPGCEQREPRQGPLAATPRGVGGTATQADLELVLRAAPTRVGLLAGRTTPVWGFTSEVLHGPSDAVRDHARGTLGPTLRVKRGQRLRIHFDNAIGEPSIVHWHGLYVAQQNDGHPSLVVPSRGRYTYDFPVDNRAGLYWYHPHPADRTGPQVYFGLAGLVRVVDEEEAKLGLPDGDRELTLVLQDRTFDGDNALVYRSNRMVGFLGEQLLINGALPQRREVPAGPHRLRILNASNSRIYDLAWSDGSPMIVLGTDGGLLGAPIPKAHVVLAPAQRLDIWANFGTHPGEDVWLESRGFEGVGPMMGMGPGMMRPGGRDRDGMGPGGMGPDGRRHRMMGPGAIAPGLANGTPMRIQQFMATGRSTRARPPSKLAFKPGPRAFAVTNAGAPRTFTTAMHRMLWFLNGRRFQMKRVADNERVKLGAVEEWEFFNPLGPMAMPHPIHIHGPQFQIVQRSHGPGHGKLREGLLDQGWHDTFLLLPGDRVRLRIHFERHTGLFLYHCHNLEHEDMGMMRNYLVET